MLTLKKKTLGGTCLNVGCIPSKALLHASEQYENNLKNTGNFDWGIEVDNVKLDLQKLMKKKLGIVEDLTKGINFLFNKNKIDRFIGEAKILKENKVKILANKKEKAIKAKNIIIATGSKPSKLRNVDIDESKVVSSTGALKFDKVPKKLVVIGAGVIGLEMGTVWRRLGSEVEVIEFLPRILNGMDTEISEKFMKILVNQGIKFRLGWSVEKTSINGDVVDLQIKEQLNSNEENLQADAVFNCCWKRTKYTKPRFK